MLSPIDLEDTLGRVSKGQLTYGHAMLEFAYFRYFSTLFLKKRIPQMEMNTKLDVFKDALNIVKKGKKL